MISENFLNRIYHKIVSWEKLKTMRERWRAEKKTVVFTNGCFDLLHRGHVEYLARARELGDVLIVALNSDDSVRRLKGAERPILPQDDRAMILAALQMVDAVTLFEQDTPYELIREIVPDILVKGGDYKPDQVVGKDIVENAGGRVEIVPLVAGKSTSEVIERIQSKGNLNREGSRE
ncbi:MAG: D-glycero-beta-D-manno-heptose 1-phosphate adenylyltransferase [Calditrichaeota bacterium]|nr:D-glycero-beta-D-manno-heptose 1-phosphate adenylyltransferase [Calditrichota bacterium]